MPYLSLRRTAVRTGGGSSYEASMANVTQQSDVPSGTKRRPLGSTLELRVMCCLARRQGIKSTVGRPAIGILGRALYDAAPALGSGMSMDMSTATPRLRPESACRRGTPSDRTRPKPIPGPTVPPTSLRVNRLAMPIACTAAARAAACIRSEAAELLPVLLDAHRHGMDHWMTKGYGGYNDPQREFVARVLINLTANGEPEPLIEHLRTFAANARALQQLLHDFAILFTYDTAVRHALPAVWPLVLRTTLDAIDGGTDLHGNRHWVDYAVGALLPTPQLRTADTNPDNTLDVARADWLAPEALDRLVDRWIALATGEPEPPTRSHSSPVLPPAPGRPPQDSPGWNESSTTATRGSPPLLVRHELAHRAPRNHHPRYGQAQPVAPHRRRSCRRRRQPRR